MKRYMFVVTETLKRERHYYVEAESADAAEEKIKDFANVVRQEAPGNEKIDVMDFDVQYLVTDE